MSTYFLDGVTLDLDTYPHQWPCDSPAAVQAVYYRETAPCWVVQILADAANTGDELYTISEAEAQDMVRRYGHGPDIWACACEACCCQKCGASWHSAAHAQLGH